MERCPGYTVGACLTAALGLAHVGALVLAGLLVLSAILALILFASPAPGLALLGLATLILSVQLVSRVRHVRALNRIRCSNGQLGFWSDEARAWIPAARVESVCRKDYAYADPWRPVTLGYPGIEIRLAGLTRPVEQLYPAGTEELRDAMFRYLSRRLPGKALDR
jgi:xanthosine utilization system XapX-like protein